MAVEFQEKFLMRVATQISHISSSRRKIQHKVNKDSGLRANFIEQFIREEIHTPILSDALRLNYRPAVWDRLPALYSNSNTCWCITDDLIHQGRKCLQVPMKPKTIVVLACSMNTSALRLSISKRAPKQRQKSHLEDACLQNLHSLSTPTIRINDYDDLVLHFRGTSCSLSNQMLSRVWSVPPTR